MVHGGHGKGAAVQDVTTAAPDIEVGVLMASSSSPRWRLWTKTSAPKAPVDRCATGGLSTSRPVVE
jgi:hypothetical protein